MAQGFRHQPRADDTGKQGVSGSRKKGDALKKLNNLRNRPKRARSKKGLLVKEAVRCYVVKFPDFALARSPGEEARSQEPEPRSPSKS